MRYLSSAEVEELRRTIDGTADLARGGARRLAATERTARAQPTPHLSAAAWLVGLVREKPFVTHNHGTAVMAVGLLFLLNGWFMEKDDDALQRIVCECLVGRLDIAGVADELARLTGGAGT